MVGGKFQCLGSIPRLKGRFGGHLTLELRCRADGHQDYHHNDINGGSSEGSENMSTSKDANTAAAVVAATASAPTLAAAAASAALPHSAIVDGSTSQAESAVTTSATEAVKAVVDRAVAFVANAFPGSRVQERHGLFVRFEIPLAPVLPPPQRAEGEGGSGEGGGGTASPLSSKYTEDDNQEDEMENEKIGRSTSRSNGGSGVDKSSSLTMPQATTLADTFRVIERAKDELQVDDYAVGHGSLEQVCAFSSFTNPIGVGVC